MLFPDTTTVIVLVAYFAAVVTAKLLVARAYARHFRLNVRTVTIICAVFNVADVPLLLMPFYLPGATPSVDKVWSLGGPVFWGIEGLVYYYLARLPAKHAAPITVLTNFAQNVILTSLVFLVGLRFAAQ